MNGRIVLTPGTVLKLSTKTGYTEYTIRRELARGCSCIVYDASYTDNLGNYKYQGMLSVCAENDPG